jgi:hypothetical protein
MYEASMIAKLWKWLIPLEESDGILRRQGYVIICDGNMGYLTPIDVGASLKSEFDYNSRLHQPRLILGG